ncbi:MAG: hypothetical protein KA180_06235 [Gemmatimonadales bacterium]|nr:hypothetical protein [Gemmatimonadales bacterium]
MLILTVPFILLSIALVVWRRGERLRVLAVMALLGILVFGLASQTGVKRAVLASFAARGEYTLDVGRGVSAMAEAIKRPRVVLMSASVALAVIALFPRLLRRHPPRE